MSGRYHRVGSGVWNQPWDDEQRLLALYLLTCEHRTVEGLFRLPAAYIAEDTGWDLNRVEDGLRRLEDDGFIRRHQPSKTLLLVNALEWQQPANENGVKAALSKLADLPRTPLLAVLVEQAERFCPRLAAAVAERFPDRLASSGEQPLSSTSGHPPTPAPTPAPTPTPAPNSNAHAASGDAVCEEKSNVVKPKFGGRVVPAERLEMTKRLLVYFNEQLGTNYGPLRANGRPSEALSRILRAATEDALTEPEGRRMIDDFRDNPFGTGAPTTGQVFSRAMVEKARATLGLNGASGEPVRTNSDHLVLNAQRHAARYDDPDDGRGVA